MPAPLYWKRWCDRYGLPIDGGWVDQPLYFMKEIDAARRGEQRRLQERETAKESVILKVLLDIRTLLTRPEQP